MSAILILLCLCLTSCASLTEDAADQNASAAPGDTSGTVQDRSEEPAFSPIILRKTISLPGLDREYRLLFISDLHIIAPVDPQLNDDKKEEAGARRLAFRYNGVPSADIWTALAPTLDNYGADAVILGGDMVDYCSAANLDILSEGLKQIDTPLLYVRADHDTETWYTDSYMTKEDSKALHDSLAENGADNPEILSLDLGGLLLIGINDSTSQLTPSASGTLQSLLDQNRTSVVITHVPLKPSEDTGLSDASRSAWQDRVLLWGNDCYYVPDGSTASAYARLYREDSPARLLLAGHLHFPYEGPLTPQTTQLVLAPACEGHIALLTLTP